ncbi:hypothetical protein GGR56DRAFT_526224 [Xylariaceae sp. FL0804]|nr:hypothetical protein GGR56DRAFT_526224 [Xylariaceae sp. FL0804]
MVKFVGLDSAGLPLKRRAVAQACSSCRRRKKRCIHAVGDGRGRGDDSAGPLHHPSGQQSPPSTWGPPGHATDAARATPASTQSTPPPPSSAAGHAYRFVGHSNPEAIFTEATSLHSRRDASAPGGLGVWQQQQSPPSPPGSRTTVTTGGNTGTGTPALLLLQPSPRQDVQALLQSHVRAHCLPCRPPAADYAVLRRIYIQKLEPIFPVLLAAGEVEAPPPYAPPPDGGRDDDVAGILLQQVVSLAAAADPKATPHLRLLGCGGAGAGGAAASPPGSPQGSPSPSPSPEPALLTRHEFCAVLSGAVHTALDAGLVADDRVQLTRITAALSLYMQQQQQLFGGGPSSLEADAPALLNGRAVHQMHTLGLHLAVEEEDDDDGDDSGGGGGNGDAESVRTLFCCLWALDRLSAAFYGRACLIHERDVGWDLDDCVARQRPEFRLFLLIVQLLDRVIGLYRPSKRREMGVLVEMPVFEQMILDAGAARVSNSCLASLEVFYHSVAILSSQTPADVVSASLPSPATNSRRSLSADRITSIVGGEFAGQLCYMPLIPYGVSLSLSVSYRKMRHSWIPMFQKRGRQAFRANTRLLKSMNDTFWTARAMVAMAEQVSQEMDKAEATLAQEAGRADVLERPDPVAQGPDRPLEADNGIGATVSAPVQGDSSLYLLGTPSYLDVFGHIYHGIPHRPLCTDRCQGRGNAAGTRMGSGENHPRGLRPGCKGVFAMPLHGI